MGSFNVEMYLRGIVDEYNSSRICGGFNISEVTNLVEIRRIADLWLQETGAEIYHLEEEVMNEIEVARNRGEISDQEFEEATIKRNSVFNGLTHQMVGEYLVVMRCGLRCLREEIYSRGSEKI